LKAPSRYAPSRDLQAAQARAAVVVEAMQAVGHLTREEAAALIADPARPARRSRDAAHYAVDWTLDQLPDFVGRPRADLDIITSLDPQMQLAAEAAIASVMDEAGAARQAEQAAMVVMAPDGAVLAMVGGRTYARSSFNRAVQAKRQPGSAFKPFIYLAALENGLKPSDSYEDAPLSIGDWSPKNYDEGYAGRMSAAQALARSVNTIAVRINEQTGRQKTIDMARRLGLTGRLRAHPSLALGSFEVSLLELTAAYAHFANGGYRVVPHIIHTVISASGDVLYDRLPPAPLPSVAAHHIGALNAMLRQSITDGTGRAALVQGLDMAGKTGTSQNWRDAWFIGYTGNLVVGVWVGNDDGRPMQRVSGGTLPARIWAHFMKQNIDFAATAALPEAAPPKSGLGGLFDRLFGG